MQGKVRRKNKRLPHLFLIHPCLQCIRDIHKRKSDDKDHQTGEEAYPPRDINHLFASTEDTPPAHLRGNDPKP